MSNKHKIPVGIICSNALIIEGLRRVLELHEFEIRYSAADIPMGLGEAAAQEAEGLLVLHFNSSENCVDDYEAIRSEVTKPRIVVLADKFRIDQVVDAFRAGVVGYVSKDIGCEQLLETLRLIHLGEKVLPSELINHLASRITSTGTVGGSEAEVAELLTDREVETLRCLIQGFPNKVIAYRLSISEATVKVHVKAILRKLTVQNRTQAAIWAVNHGMGAGAVMGDQTYSAMPELPMTNGHDYVPTVQYIPERVA